MASKTFIYAGSEAGSFYRKEAAEDGWRQLTENDGLAPDPEVRAIVIHPKNPEKVYVGTQRGLYFSTDRGDCWTRAALPEGRTVWSIAFRPDNPQSMFLGTQGNDVYRSDDGGESWQYVSTIVNPDAVQMSFAVRILGLSIEAKNPDNMFAAMEVGGIARSRDSGKTWDIMNDDLRGVVDLLDLHAVAVGSPDSNAAFIANRTGVWRSKDHGQSWSNTHIENFSPLFYSRCVRVSPHDPNTVYACIGGAFYSEEGGVVRSTDLGETWERFDRGVSPRSTAFGVAANAQDPSQVYFCTRNGQVFGTHDGGATWKEHLLPEGDQDVISVACSSA